MKFHNIPFQFSYALKQKIVRDLRIVTEHIGDLLVEGNGRCYPEVNSLPLDDRFAVDIDYIRWNGTDIKPVLELTGMLEEIEEAALRYVAQTPQVRMKEAA